MRHPVDRRERRVAGACLAAAAHFPRPFLDLSWSFPVGARLAAAAQAHFAAAGVGGRAVYSCSIHHECRKECITQASGEALYSSDEPSVAGELCGTFVLAPDGSAADRGALSSPLHTRRLRPRAGRLCRRLLLRGRLERHPRLPRRRRRRQRGGLPEPRRQRHRRRRLELLPLLPPPGRVAAPMRRRAGRRRPRRLTLARAAWRAAIRSRLVNASAVRALSELWPAD